MEPFYTLDFDAEDMGYITQPEQPPEINLWRAVIVRMLKDALGVDQEDQRLTHLNKMRGNNWFHYAGDDFKRVCEYAGLEPDHVQNSVLEFLTNPNFETQIFSYMTKGSSNRFKHQKQFKEAA